MRDRLIKLIESTRCWGANTSAELADRLLAEGVIIPPCKVGETVYVPWHWEGQFGIASVEVQEFGIYDRSNHLMFFIDMESDDEDYNQTYGGWKLGESIGETVFLTREEAEAALERNENEQRKAD